jgi:hypothetical protein
LAAWRLFHTVLGSAPIETWLRSASTSLPFDPITSRLFSGEPVFNSVCRELLDRPPSPTCICVTCVRFPFACQILLSKIELSNALPRILRASGGSGLNWRSLINDPLPYVILCWRQPSPVAPAGFGDLGAKPL